MSLGKRTRVSEKVAIVFTVDFINALNHMEFVYSSLSLQARFGVLTTQFGTLWAIQLGLRVEF